MVFLDSYSLDVMEELREQRKAGILCDANVKVGDTQIPAHKCVLVACSNFFKTLYTGPSKKEDGVVDLSEVTKSDNSVEAVVDFMYSGLIEIDGDNVEAVLKLSSYLEIAPLQELCVEFITTNLKLNLDMDTCLQFYLIAVEMEIPMLEKVFHQTIRPRFHDCIIFKPSSLKISPKHLRYLLKDCDIFKHCSNVDIVSFVTEWLKSGKTEAHEQVGCEVIDYISNRNSKLPCCLMKDDAKALIERISNEIEGVEIFIQFKQKLCSLMADNENEADMEGKTGPLDVNALTEDIEALGLESLDTEELGEEKKNVNILLCLIPNKHLIDLVNKKPKKHTYIYDRLKDNKAIYDVCVYVPRNQTWYYMTECRPERAFKVSTPKSDPRDIIQSFVKYNKLYIVLQHKNMIYTFDLESHKWDTIDFKQPTEENASKSDSSNRVYVVPVGEATTYLILSVAAAGTRGRTGTFFKCFKLTSDNTWQFMFSTPVIEEFLQQNNQFSAIYSVANKELIIVYRSGHTSVIVVDMETADTEEPHCRILRQDMGAIDYDTCWILQDEKKIYIVEETFEEETYIVQCKCQYDKNSWELTKAHMQIVRGSCSQPTYDSLPSSSYGYTLSIGDKSCIWLFQGDTDSGSSLMEVALNPDNRLVAREHKPPPFSCATILATGLVKRELLTQLEPIKKYIETTKKKPAKYCL